MTRTRWIQLLLLFNIVGLLSVAIWPLLSPRGFYDNFPGAGMHWIDINGPYNEHFIRDFGALNAALLVVLLFALWKMTPSLLQASSIAMIVYALPHTIYHLAHLDVYESSEKFTAVAPLGLQIVAGALILWLSAQRHRPGTA
ncbi:MAG: hypothetical protein QOI61_2637 [Actinomycetota bacterium]|jgi:hypothetical protein